MGWCHFEKEKETVIRDDIELRNTIFYVFHGELMGGHSSMNATRH